MVFHDRERIVMRDLRVRFVERVNVGENGAERGRENRDLFLALREKSLAKERARDSVSYRVHEGSEREEVYTIRLFQATGAFPGYSLNHRALLFPGTGHRQRHRGDN